MAREPRVRPVVRLEDFGTVLSLDDLSLLIQRSRRYVQDLASMQKKTGVRTLPEEIPGMKYRFTRDAVARWLRTGIGQPVDRTQLRRVS